MTADDNPDPRCGLIPAVIYAAKSTEDKRGSIPTQFTDCREMAEREDWEVVGEFADEAFSAYHGNRGPGLAAAKQRAIEAAQEHGRCILVAQDTDRFARGAGDAPGAADHLGELFFAMRRQRVELWSVRSGKLDSIRAVLEGERSHDETERKAQATAAGIGRVKAKGKPFGAVPLGYVPEPQVIEGEVVHRRVVDEKAMAIVRMAFEARDRGLSHGAIARKLNAAGHRTGKWTRAQREQGLPEGREFNSRGVRDILANADIYAGRDVYPKIIEPDLADRVEVKGRRKDYGTQAAEHGGKKPLADFMLRHLAVCAGCGQPMYAITRRRGRTGQLGLARFYQCSAQTEHRGTCRSERVPAELAEQHVLRHLEMFVGNVEEWIAARLSERSSERTARLERVDADRAALAVMDAQRDKLFAEYQRLVDEGNPLARYALEPVAALDDRRGAQLARIADADAALAEFSGEVSADAVLDFYNGVVDLVRGRIARAEGVAEINASLRDSLTGIWLQYDGATLAAEVELRPTGWDTLDKVAADIFAGRDARGWLNEYNAKQTPLSGYVPLQVGDVGRRSTTSRS